MKVPDQPVMTSFTEQHGFTTTRNENGDNATRCYS